MFVFARATHSIIYKNILTYFLSTKTTNMYFTHSFKNTQYNTRYRFAITFCYYSPV